jgi:hypothetical protein
VLNSDKKIAKHDPTKERSISDGGGLVLIDRRFWRFRYRYAGIPRMLSFGLYPETSIEDARTQRDAARKLLKAGIDPSMKRQQDKAAAQRAIADSFRAIAEKWLVDRKKVKKWSQSTCDQAEGRLKTWVYPIIGKMPIADIGHAELEGVFTRIESKGAGQTALKVRSLLSGVFRYAVQKKKCAHNPAKEYELDVAETDGFPGLQQPAQVGELMRRITPTRASRRP